MCECLDCWAPILSAPAREMLADLEQQLFPTGGES
jgi:hypothetical protein